MENWKKYYNKKEREMLDDLILEIMQKQEETDNVFETCIENGLKLHDEIMKLMKEIIDTAKTGFTREEERNEFVVKNINELNKFKVEEIKKWDEIYEKHIKETYSDYYSNFRIAFMDKINKIALETAYKLTKFKEHEVLKKRILLTINKCESLEDSILPIGQYEILFDLKNDLLEGDYFEGIKTICKLVSEEFEVETKKVRERWNKIFSFNDMADFAKSLGYKNERVNGSHNIFVHNITNKIVPIPRHNKDLGYGLMLAIQKQLIERSKVS